MSLFYFTYHSLIECMSLSPLMFAYSCDYRTSLSLSLVFSEVNDLESESGGINNID